MSKDSFKRSWFFWIDSLHITRKERVTITLLFGLILFLSGIQILIEEKVVPPPENHAQILEEFERKSELVRQRKLANEERYTPSESTITIAEATEEGLQAKVINLNTATQQELELLPGIGKSYAQRIIEYRETIGEFTSVEELINVKGIGEKTLEKLKPFLTLELITDK